MPERRIATVAMLDVVGSTEIAAQLGDARYRELSSRFARSVRAGLKRFGGHEEDNAGDGFFATFPQPDRAIRFATTLADEVRAFGIEIRSGIHTGQTEVQEGKAQGIAVVIGARVMSLAGPGEVLVTSTTKELVTGSGFGFEDFSAHELKGVPGTWQVFAVAAVDDRERTPPIRADEAARRLAEIQSSEEARPRRRQAALAGGLAALVIAAGVIAYPRDDEPPQPPGSNVPAPKSVVNVDPETGNILSEIAAPVSQQGGPRGTPPSPVHPMAVGEAAVWTVRSFRYLYSIDPEHEEVDEILLEAGPYFPFNIAVGFGKVWIANSGGLYELNPSTHDQRSVFRHQPTGDIATSPTTDVVIGNGYVWLGTADGILIRLDPSSGRHREWSDLDPIHAIAFGHGSVWTGDTIGGTVTRYDADSLEPAVPIAIDAGVDALVAGEQAVWALSRSAGLVTEIDVDEEETETPVQVGGTPAGLSAGDGAVWVGDEDGLIRRVDEATGQVSELPFGAEIRDLVYDHEADTLWVDVA